MKTWVEVVRRKRTMADKDEWSEKYLKAINLIYGVISNEQLLFIKDKERAFIKYL